MIRHARLSPSHSATWIACPNSALAEKEKRNTSSAASELGTAKHEILNKCLEENKEAKDFIGETTTNGILVDKEFSNDVQYVLRYIRGVISSRRERGGDTTVLCERPFSIQHITKEEKAHGTVDVTVITNWPNGDSHLDIIDAKFGHVEVQAEGNTQLLMYASGVMEQYELVNDFKTVSLAIGQVGNCHSVDMEAWEVSDWVNKTARPAAEKAVAILARGSYEIQDFNVTSKGCKWCRAKPDCPAVLKLITDMTGVELTAESNLFEKYKALEVIQEWCKATLAEVNSLLLSGKTIPGLKLVQGRAPNRTWKDEKEVIKLLQGSDLGPEEVYSSKLNSPKSIMDAVDDEQLRAKLHELILKGEGKPCVAFESDSRKEIKLESPDCGFDLC